MRLLSSKNDSRRWSEPIAMILAAGNGCRLQSRSKMIPKPQIRVRGLSLAERSVAQLRNVGIDRFVVVLGDNADLVRTHFEGVAKRRCCVNCINTCVRAQWTSDILRWSLASGLKA